MKIINIQHNKDVVLKKRKKLRVKKRWKGDGKKKTIENDEMKRRLLCCWKYLNVPTMKASSNSWQVQKDHKIFS